MAILAVLLAATATIPAWVWLFVVLAILFGFFGNRTLAGGTYATDPWPWYGSWSPLGLVIILILLWYFIPHH
jgi:hypothetical protein